MNASCSAVFWRVDETPCLETDEIPNQNISGQVLLFQIVHSVNDWIPSLYIWNFAMVKKGVGRRTFVPVGLFSIEFVQTDYSSSPIYILYTWRIQTMQISDFSKCSFSHRHTWKTIWEWKIFRSVRFSNRETVHVGFGWQPPLTIHYAIDAIESFSIQRNVFHTTIPCAAQS